MKPKKLPSELEEEILIRTPPFSLSRFKTVCKRWNSLFNDKRFISNNHFACIQPGFIIHTRSKTFSLSINLEGDPKAVAHEFILDTVLKSQIDEVMCCYNGFVLCDKSKEAALWNPLLKQTRLIKPVPEYEPFDFWGVGYDSRKPEKSYKIIGDHCQAPKRSLAIYEVSTNAWKYIAHDPKQLVMQRLCYKNVPLNGNLYWIVDNLITRECCIRFFDCSLEIFKHFCVLPCKKSKPCGIHVLEMFKGDRFSLFKQCKGSEKIEVWVTKNKIDDSGEGESIVWMMFMTVSIPNIGQLFYYPTYFIVENNVKSLVMCYTNDSGRTSIYIVKGDVLKKIQLDYKVFWFPRSTITYIPSLIPLPT